MRMNGRKREGQRNVLPPQIFNGEEYRGVREHVRGILTIYIVQGL